MPRGVPKKKRKKRSAKGYVGRRDATGLRLDQKRFLAELVQHGNVPRACENTDTSLVAARQWLRFDEKFRLAVDALLTGPMMAQASVRLVSLLPKAGDAFEDALDAHHPVEVEVMCPECLHHFTTHVELPNWGPRLRVAEDVYKIHGQLTSKVEVEGKIEHEHSLSLEDRIAIAKYHRSQPLPPQVEEDLRSRGLLAEGAVEGQFRKVGGDGSAPEE